MKHEKRTTKPTVCHVLHTLSVGGAEILAKEFSLKGSSDFRFVFACLDDIGTMGHELIGSNHEVVSLNRRSGLDLGVATRLASYCKSHKVDVIHAHQYTPFFYASLSRFMGNKAPILFTEHGRTFPDFRRPKRVLANRFLLSKKDQVVAVGKQVKNALIENEGIPEKKIKVIYNGIDVERFKPNGESRHLTRQKLGIREGEIVLIHVARLNPLKDHLAAVKTFDHIREHPKIRLLIVGEGEEEQNIRNAIADRNLESTVSMLGLRKDIPDLLNAADACLLTSRSEGIPLTLAEAMATELPCIATDVGGVPEIVTDRTTGFLCPAGDTRKMASRIVDLVNSEELRSRMGQAGRARIAKLFNDKSMHAQYQEAYQSMATWKSRVTSLTESIND